MDPGDWRSLLQDHARSDAVNTIKHDLLRFLPIYIQCEPERLNSFVVKLEEVIYTTATSKLNYLERISSAMETISTKNKSNVMQSENANNDNEFSVLAKTRNLTISGNNEKREKDSISSKYIEGTYAPPFKESCVGTSGVLMNHVISNAERDLVFPEKVTSRVLKLEEDLYLANLSITEKIQELKKAENGIQIVQRERDYAIMAKNNEIAYLRDQIDRLRDHIFLMNMDDDSNNDDGDGDDSDGDDNDDSGECISEEYN